MGTLTSEQVELVKRNPEQPLHLIDPDTNTDYVPLPAIVYEQVTSTTLEFDPTELSPALHKAMRDEGWDGPKMDEYNHYG